jgi:hypothetical protein
MITRNARERGQRNEQSAVYLPSAADIRRGTAEVQQRWTPRQRSRRAIGRPRNVRFDTISPRDLGERWIPGLI